jgi:hypothetical protein
LTIPVEKICAQFDGFKKVKIYIKNSLNASSSSLLPVSDVGLKCGARITFSFKKFPSIKQMRVCDYF